MQWPKIRCVKRIHPHLAEYNYISACRSAEGGPDACYEKTTNTIWLTLDGRQYVIHELLHWWGYMRNGWDHWIHDWLDDPDHVWLRKIGL